MEASMGETHKAGLTRPRQSMPAFVRQALEERGLGDAYRGRPPYQRNDYLWWIKSAKQDATKQRRLSRMLDELKRGDVYMGMRWSPKRSAA
jgi:uncharacterized protein YdeI (YjbR/CyaY-like superfamily)